MNDTQRQRLQEARAAIHSRAHWSAFAETPSEKIYGEGSKAKGEADFRALLGKPFTLAVAQEGSGTAAGESRSPFGTALDLSYPQTPPDVLLKRSETAQKNWRKLPLEKRLAVLSEMLDRLAAQSFLMAHAVMHTTGQPFVMAFQAGGPHALDRALEAMAYAQLALEQPVEEMQWEKVTGKDKEGNPVKTRLAKRFIARGKGIGLVIGCATFPTWNSYPGIFANLATGNSVIVKPGETATLPLAIAVDTMRQVLQAQGLDPDTVQLAATGGERSITQQLATDARVKLIDYTGGPQFGQWLQRNCPGKQLYLELAGINNILIHSTDNLRGMCANIAFSLSLFAGQMCTAPQNIYLPKDGIQTDQGHLSYQAAAEAIAQAVEKLLGEEGRRSTILGALNSEAVAKRVEDMAASDGHLLRCRGADYADYPDARSATPQILQVSLGDKSAQDEQFGPIAFVIACDDADSALAALCRSVEDNGAMTSSLYSSDADFKARAVEAIADAGSPLSVNLTGGVYVNQSAAFSDFHGSGLNPSANCSLSDLGFVSNRFGWVSVREQQEG